MDADRPQRSGEPRPFVGRDRDLEQLVGIVASSRPPVLVAGDPGIGKSRLLAELDTRMAARGWRVAWGRAWRDQGAPPYWLWTQVARDLLGSGTGTDLARVVLDEPEGAERFELFDATAALLREAAETQPVLVLLDDLHAADDPSLLLTRFVVEQLGRSNVMVVGTYRTRDASHASAMNDHIETLASDGTEMALHGLELDAVERLVGDAQRATEVHAVTGGNPLFIDQVVRLGAVAAEAGAPASPPGVDALRAAISHRIDALTPAHRQALAGIAILAGDLDPSRLSDLLRADPASITTALDDLDASGLIGSGSDPTGWVLHPLVADVAQERVGPAEAAALHERAALLVGDDPDRAAERAFHLLHAGPAGRDDAVEACVMAADVAIGATAFEDAITHYERALEVLDEAACDGSAPHARRRLAVLLELGRVLRIADRIETSDATFEEALTLADELDDPEGFALAALRGGVQYFFAADLHAPISETCRRALDRLPEGDSALRVRLLAELVTRSDSEVGAEASMADDIVAMARRVGDPVALGAALAAQQRCGLGPATLARRISTAHELLALARTTNEPPLAVQGRYLLFGSMLEAGDLRGFEAELSSTATELDELAGRHEARLGQWYSFVRAMFEGDLAEAESIAHLGLEVGLRHGDPAALRVYGAQFGMVCDLPGRHDELMPLLEAQLRVGSAPVFHAALAAARAHVGRLDEARAEIAEIDLDEIPEDMHWLLTMGLLAEASVSVDDRVLGAAVRERLLPYVDRFVPINVGAAPWGTVARPLGLVATRLGRHEEAVAHFERAVEVCARLGARPWLAQCQLDLAAALVRCGRGDDSRVSELVTEAGGAIGQLDLAYLSGEADELRPTIGHFPPRPEPEIEAPRPTVSVLGTFEAASLDGRVARWDSRKARELLKILVARRGAPVHREVLMDLIWPDLDPSALGNRLSVALSTVRRALDPDRTFATNDLIDADRTSVRLRIEAVVVDVERFLELAQRALTAADADDPDAQQLLEAALRAHRGPALPDEPYAEWANALRSEVWATHLRVVRALADATVEAGDDVAAVDALRRVVEADPHDEASRRRLVEALERIGAAGATVARRLRTA